jgi:hypothetical protein
MIDLLPSVHDPIKASHWAEMSHGRVEYGSRRVRAARNFNRTWRVE